MTANSVNGSGNRAHSGAQTLALLATPVNSLILQTLEEGAKRQTELRRAAGFPAQTTLRSHIRRLLDLGCVVRNRQDHFPGILEFELTAAGRDLAVVASILERWLERSPSGPLQLGTSPAKSAVKALAEGWSTTILRALAAGPLSLTELDQIIGSLSYPSLERRLSAMRMAGQIEAKPNGSKGTPYAVTRWLRQGVAPLTAAIRWERRHLPTAPPLSRLDTEAAFMLATPLLPLADDLSGGCRMAMEIPNGRSPTLAGVLVNVEGGKVVSCDTRLPGATDAWASGSAEAWLAALIEADSAGLELGGDGHLAHALLHSLRCALFAEPVVRIAALT